MLLSLFVLTIYCWVYSIHLGVVCFPGETPLSKTKFSLTSDNQMEIAFRLGMGLEAEYLFFPVCINYSNKLTHEFPSFQSFFCLCLL